jgi:hypothetical protein
MRTLRLAALTFRSILAVALSLMLVAQPAFAASAFSDKELPNAPTPAAEPQGLTITILDGEGALNNIRQRTAREPIVQVTDENHKPIAGAAVLFTINPGSSGAGASFSGASSLKVQTDATGRASAHGLTNNAQKGEFTIAVVATFAALTATATIHQTNGFPVTKVSSNPQPPRRILKWSIVGGAIVVGIVVGIVTHNGGGNSNHITIGGGGVGPP